MSRGRRHADGCKDFPPVPERNTDILQVLVSQMGEYGDVNFIFGKTPRVLPETKSLKPVGNLLHIASRFTGPILSRMDTLYFLRDKCRRRTHFASPVSINSASSCCDRNGREARWKHGFALRSPRPN